MHVSTFFRLVTCSDSRADVEEGINLNKKENTNYVWWTSWKSKRIKLLAMQLYAIHWLLLLLSGFPTPSYPFSIYNLARNLANFVFGSSLISETDMSTVALIRRQGYPVETHAVLTEDGYILEMHRIPHGRHNQTHDPHKYPVIVQHGNFQTSADWLLNSPESDALGFYLADQGYDVWLGNQRRNEYSTKHSQFPVGSSQFWNFSFHEMGIFDLPGVLDYVTKAAERKKAHYIGFSMGTTAFFAGLSKRPEYSEKIGIGIAMGPSTFQDHFFNGWVKLVAPFVWVFQVFQRFAGNMPVLPTFVANLLHKILPIICHPRVDLLGVCKSAIAVSFGNDQGKISKEKLHLITKVSPSSSPLKAFIHEMQLMATGKFTEYDYGNDRNMVMYGREHPPDYNLTNVRAPIALLVGPNDNAAHQEDAKTLAKRLPNLVDFHYVPYEHFTHLDFCYASDVGNLVYHHVARLLGRFDNT